jgi:hypothetical protein
MINSSQLGGNSLAIGDITQSYRTVLADGKRLVPCDGTLVNAVTYPLLAAAMTPRQKLVTAWSEGTSNEVYGISVAEGSKVLAFTQAVNGMLNSTNAVTSAITPIKTAAAGLYHVGVGASRDGKYILSCYNSTIQVQVSASSDFGATFSANTVAASGTFLEPLTNYDSAMVDIWVKDDGTSMRIALRCTSGTQAMRFFESTNFGITWNAIWVDATVYTSAYLTRGMFSPNGQNYLVYPFAGASSTLKLRIVAGVRTLIAGDVGIYPATQQLNMVMSPDSNTFLIARSNGASQIKPTLLLSCSTDFGATWKFVSFNISALDFNISGVQVADMIHSRVVPNTVYIRVEAKPIQIVNTITTKLLALNYVTGEVTVISTLHATSYIVPSAQSKFAIEPSIANPAREYLTFVDAPSVGSNVKSIYTIDYDKYLPLAVTNNSLPFKVVADPA